MDHIDTHIPMVATLFNEKKYEEVSSRNIKEVSDDFFNRFQLKIPSHAMTSIINRMKKKGYFRKEHGSFKPVFGKLKVEDISIQSKTITREYNSLILKIKNFFSEKYGEDISEENIENGLLSYLKHYDIDILFLSDSKSILPDVKKAKKILYLIGKFIEHAYTKDAEAFQYLVNISIGHALASSIIIDKKELLEGSLNKLNIFFDTPWLFDLLGTKGIGRKNMALELLDLVLENKGKTKLFDINFGELQTNLDLCISDFTAKRENGSKTYQDCLQNEIGESEIMEINSNLTELLEKLGLEVKSPPDHNETKKYEIDVVKLYDLITKTYEEQQIIDQIRKIDEELKEHEKALKKDSEPTEVKSTKKKIAKEPPAEEDDSRDNQTIWRDVNAISGIYRLRKGNIPKNLRDTKALFVTRNSSLALAAKRFNQDKGSGKSAIPTTITDTLLGTMIWLNTPEIADKIARKKLISDCFALTSPDPALISQYLEECEKLKSKSKISEKEYLVLRSYQGAYKILTSKTYGDVNEFSAKTPFEVLQELIHINESKENQRRDELEKVKDEELEKSSELVEALRTEIEETTNRLEGQAAGKQGQLDRIYSVTFKITKGSVNIIFWIPMAFVFYYAYRIQILDNWEKNISSTIITSALFILSGLNLLFGYTFTKFVYKLTNKIHHSIYEFLTK